MLTRRLATVARQTPSLPLIDFGRFLTGDPQDKKRCSHEIIDAFSRYGFLYLTNTSIPSTVVKQAFDTSASFFNLPLAEKLSSAWKTPESNRGYAAQGREKVSKAEKGAVQDLRQRSPDIKESFEIGKEPSESYQNEWPPTLPSLQPVMMDFYEVGLASRPLLQ
jgi:isopenicillin N synthase-like dioxygenase